MAAGEERALAALYDAYGDVAYGLAFAIAGNESLAEAVVADAFAEAWRSAATFDQSRTSVLAWLTSIVRRSALAVRKPGDRPAVDTRYAGRDDAKSGAALPVREALRGLTASQRAVIELSYYRGLTVAQIAAQLGAPENGARELLRSAMRDLRSALSGNAVNEEHVVTRA
jgi:RNA polymerase sigma-70 factor, ECF subfamily